MKYTFLPGAEKYLKAHRTKQRWHKVVACLAAVVLAGTSYALILPAVTLENPCGLPEHVHTDACWTQITQRSFTVPTCTVDAADIHVHDERCLDENGEFWCTLPVQAGHVHTDACYETLHTHTDDCMTAVRGALTCELPTHAHEDACYTEHSDLTCTREAGESHAHTNGCYAPAENLVCTLTESAGHAHDDTCYSETTTLTCGEEERPGHTHGEGCFDESGALLCTESEDPGHSHDDTCRTTTRTLTCGQDEHAAHTHGPDCYETVSRLICTESTAPHAHGDGCYTVTRELTCPVTDAHSHTDDCYEWTQEVTCGLPDQSEEEPELVCTLDELVPHTHGEGCYDGEGALICEKSIVTAHQHTDACFTVVTEPVDTETLTCLIPEGEGGHAHGEDCYDENGQLICDAEESEGHVHGPRCYGTWELTCGLEEHTHTEACQGHKPFTDEEQGQIDAAAALIDALPTAEELTEELSSIEDEDAFVARYLEAQGQYQAAKSAFDALTEVQQATVKNADQLSQLRELFEGILLLPTDTTGDNIIKLTWKNNQNLDCNLYLHYVDENGLPVSVNRPDNSYQLSFKNTDNTYISNYAELGITEEGQSYHRAFIELNNEQIDVCRMSYNGTNGDPGWKYTTPTSENDYVADEKNSLWFTCLHQESGDTPVDYHVYVEIIQYYNVKTTVHENIHLRLFDYGTYINKDNEDIGGDGKVPFYFFQSQGALAGIDGDYGGSKETTHISTPPIMAATLNTNGYPVANSKSLYYLFREKTGLEETGATKPRMEGDYSSLRNSGIAGLYGKQENNLYYATPFRSMAFDLEGDGGLFQYVNGYYVYDSARWSAYYSQSDKKFLLSETLIAPGHTGYTTDNKPDGPGYLGNTYTSSLKQSGNFLPFDQIVGTGRFQSVTDTMNEEYKGDTATVYYTGYDSNAPENALSTVANMGFGMSMEINFYMPSDGKMSGEDMVFEFLGDDDVWVYIDDVLILDIGGTHGSLKGTINFATGAVSTTGNAVGTLSSKESTLKEIFENAKLSDDKVNTSQFHGETFSDWTPHTLKFFYMERGGNISYCRLKFNMPPLPENSLTVSKELTAENGSDADVVDHLQSTMEYQFKVVKADTGEVLIPEGTIFSLSGAGVAENTTGTVGEGGIFTLKHGQLATFTNMAEYFNNEGTEGGYKVIEILPDGLHGQYGSVEYATTTGTGSYTKNEETGSFTDLSSPQLSVDSTNVVKYTNKVDTSKLAQVNISKSVKGDLEPAAETVYRFLIEVGPTSNGLANLPEGTAYTVTDPADGQTESKTVGSDGCIELKNGQTATILLLSGTYYSVQEQTAGQTFTPTYTLDGTPVTNADGTPADRVTGQTEFKQEGHKIAVHAENTYPCGKLTIAKQVNNTYNAADTAGSFTFNVRIPVSSTWTDRAYTVDLIPLTDDGTTTTTTQSIDFTRDGITGYANGTLTLTHGQKATFKDFPVGMTVTVTETSTDGYAVSWKQGDTTTHGASIEAKVGTDDVTLTCINTTGYTLPQTGGPGTGMFTMGGLLMTFGAAWLLFRRRKEAEGAV